MDDIVKFQSLELNQKYYVLQYDEPIKSEFGNYRILLVSKAKSNKKFQLFTTPLLYKYIEQETPTEIFSFIVKEKGNKKYPFIDGYSREKNWTVLQ